METDHVREVSNRVRKQNPQRLMLFWATGSVSPDELLDVGVGDNHGLLVNLGGMLIEGVGGLGAEVAVSVVKIERINAVFAADTLELYSPFDPIDSVVTHGLIVIVCSEGRTAPRWAVESNLRSPLCEHHQSLWSKFPEKTFSTNPVTRSTFERFLLSTLHPEVPHL